MRNRRLAEALTQMIHVGSQVCPGPEQDWNCSQHGEHKEERDDQGSGLRVCLEDVVDFWESAVAEGCGDGGRGCVRVDGDGKVEDVVAESFGRAKGGEEEGCPEGLLAG